MYALNMRRLREPIHQKRTDLWQNQSWIFTHANAPAHTSMLVREFLSKNKNHNHASTTVFTGFDLL